MRKDMKRVIAMCFMTGACLCFSACGVVNKGQTSEGGVRVPCIAWWPGEINPGTTCNVPSSVIDFFPTFAALSNIQLNDIVKRDGADISDYLFNPGVIREPRPSFYWHVGYLMAVRYGDWKLNLLGDFTEDEQQNILKSTYKHTVFPDHIELYNLRSDTGETINVADKFPEIVAQIRKLAEKEKTALGEYNSKGSEVRKTIFVESPEPLIKTK